MADRAWEEALKLLEAGISPLDVEQEITRKYGPAAAPNLRELQGAPPSPGFPSVLPTLPGSLAGKLRIAPTQQISPSYQASPPVVSPQITTDERRRVLDYVREKFRVGPKPEMVGPEIPKIPAPELRPEARDIPLPVDDYAARYQKASEDERQAMFGLGLSKDLAQSMRTMLTTGSHIITGSPPPQFGTGMAEARLGSAQMMKQDLSIQESINPRSQLSKAARDLLRSADPNFVKSLKPQTFEGLSHYQIKENFPFLSKALDRELRKAQINYYNTFREKQYGLLETGEARRKKALGMLEAGGMKDLEFAQNGLQAIKRIRETFNNDESMGGPAEGRIEKILIWLGVAPADVAVTNANIVELMARHIQSISGVAVSEREFNRLKTLGPDLVQDPAQFKALLDNFERIIQTEIKTKLDLHKARGKDVSGLREYFSEGLTTGAPAKAEQPSETMQQPPGTVKKKIGDEWYWVPQGSE